MASPPSVNNNNYDPKLDKARKAKSNDPGWKYGYWANLEKPDKLAVWEKKREFRSSKGAVWHMEQDNWKQEGLCYMGSRIGSRKVLGTTRHWLTTICGACPATLLQKLGIKLAHAILKQVPDENLLNLLQAFAPLKPIPENAGGVTVMPLLDHPDGFMVASCHH